MLRLRDPFDPRRAALVLTLAALAGCTSRPVTAPISLSSGPAPNSPVQTLLALQWAVEHKDFASLRTLFTDDYVFLFAQQDSAGNAFRVHPWNREDELAAWSHIMLGGSSEPPAERITFDFANTLVAFPSSRPGHDPRWHQEVRAEIHLRLLRGQSALEARGPGLFFLVRGDSAAIPPDLVARGFRPDSSRWWIERWEDETLSSGAANFGLRPEPARAQPSGVTTLGAIKALYR